MRLMKKGDLIMPASPNVLKAWVLASRPKTLVASLSPVLIAASLASSIPWDLFCLCLAFSICIQIGANLANDYFDYLKGADTKDRIGPARAAQSGWISLPALKKGMCFIFVLAGIISLPLLARGGLWGALIVALSILFAIWYTAGSRPLGYLGLGELLVFCFYGPIATLCTYYILTLKFDSFVFYASLPPGLLSCSILIANNLRDEASDRLANKQTLVVRFGRTFGRWEYATTVLLALSLPLFWAATHMVPFSLALPSLLLPVAYPVLKRVFRAQTPQEFVPLLPQSAGLLTLYTVLFVV